MVRKRFHLGGVVHSEQDAADRAMERLLPEGTPCNGYQFLPDDLRMISLEEAIFAVQSGWMLQYRPHGYIERLLAMGTQGVHCHTAMAQRICEEQIDVLAMSFGGGTKFTLEKEARVSNGKIDLFFPRYDLFPAFSGERSADYMRYIVDSKYGFSGIFRMALQRTPLLWRLVAAENDDGVISTGLPFCSHAFCAAYRLGGGIDPVPRKPDYQVTPNDLTWSLMFSYYGTVFAF